MRARRAKQAPIQATTGMRACHARGARTVLKDRPGLLNVSRLNWYATGRTFRHGLACSPFFWRVGARAR
jgi:hypothetical protein